MTTNIEARKAALAHVAGLVFNTPLAVSVERATTILDVIGERLLVDGFSVADTKTAGSGQPDASASGVERVTSADFEVTDQGIAVIPAYGTFVKRVFGVEAMSGVGTYGRVAAMVAAAAQSPDIRGILLQVDSPGGQAHGMLEVVRAIRAARDVKPVWAVADEMAYSGAYLLASAAERIFVPETGGVGSIGVIAALVDQSAADEKAGVRWTIISAGDRKADGHPHIPTSDAAVQAVLAKVMQVNEIFVRLVAEHRRMTPEAVLALQANTYFGKDGVAVGLADELGMCDDAMRALVAHVDQKTAVSRPVIVPGAVGVGAEVIDLDAVRAEGALRARNEEKVRANAIHAACVKAGEAGLAGAYIAEGLALADVDARLAIVAGIRDACVTAKLPELAASLIARGLTVDQAAVELQNARAAADEAIDVRSHLGPDAVGASAAATPSVRDVYRDYKAQMQGRKGE